MASFDRILYFNHGLTRPLDPRVARSVAGLLEESPHDPTALPVDTALAERVLAEARARLAALAGAQEEEILFTSGATEANNLALKGSALAPGEEILVGATEHSSVQHPARSLEKQGVRLRYIPVGGDGRADPEWLRREIGPRTRLVALMAANPETGTLQPIGEIGSVCRERGVRLLVDAAAAAAQVPIEAHAWQADFLSLSAHKFAGPRGAGALVVRRGVRVQPLIEGGVQEGGRRAGTENLLGIAGMGEAAALALREGPRRRERLGALRARLWSALQAGIPDLVRLGSPAHCLPGHLAVAVPGAEGEALLMGLWRRGVIASSGSACFAHAGKPSYVLRAMGVADDLAQSSILFALGEELSQEDVDRAAAITADVAQRLRGVSGGGDMSEAEIPRAGNSHRRTA